MALLVITSSLAVVDSMGVVGSGTVVDDFIDGGGRLGACAWQWRSRVLICGQLTFSLWPVLGRKL